MKLKIEEIELLQETEVTVQHSTNIDEETESILTYLNQFSKIINATKDGGTCKVPLNKIYYIDCVDNRTYLYLQSEVYETALKLYQLEDELTNTPFVRIGKSTIVNIEFLESVRPMLNGKLELLLLNYEKLVVNRRYVNEFRAKFGL